VGSKKGAQPVRGVDATGPRSLPHALTTDFSLPTRNGPGENDATRGFGGGGGCCEKIGAGKKPPLSTENPNCCKAGPVRGHQITKNKRGRSLKEEALSKKLGEFNIPRLEKACS